MFDSDILQQWIVSLLEEVKSQNPSLLVLPAAKGIYWISLDEGIEIPDWVRALANGNPLHFKEVIKATRSLM